MYVYLYTNFMYVCMYWSILYVCICMCSLLIVLSATLCVTSACSISCYSTNWTVVWNVFACNAFLHYYYCCYYRQYIHTYTETRDVTLQTKQLVINDVPPWNTYTSSLHIHGPDSGGKIKYRPLDTFLQYTYIPSSYVLRPPTSMYVKG